jgi:hypothetical protein
MKTTNTPTRARIRPESRFEIAPEPAAPFTRTAESELERLKNRLLRGVLDQVATPTLLAPLRRAANEAAAIAWLEPLPLLVFPLLFEEKILGVRRRAFRQELVRAQTTDLMMQAA